MRKLLKTSILVFALCFCAFAQTNKTASCPTISISTPSGGYLGRGEKVIFTANTDSSDSDKLIYNWKLSDNISIEGQGTPVISFIANEDMNYLDVKATVEVKGFPEGCNSTALKSFQILFNPGTPMVLDQYGKLSAQDEKGRLYYVASSLKAEPESIANFIIYFTKKDRYSEIKKRVDNIENILTKTYGVTKGKFKFFYEETDDYRVTTIYLLARNIPPFWNATINLEKLRPQNKLRKNKTN